MNITHVGGAARSVQSRRFFKDREQTMSYRVVIGSVLLLLSWGAVAQGLPAAPSLSYTRDIQPIFTE